MSITVHVFGFKLRLVLLWCCRNGALQSSEGKDLWRMPGLMRLLTCMYRTALGAELGYWDQGPPPSCSSSFPFVTVIANIYVCCMGQGTLGHTLITNKPCSTRGLIRSEFTSHSYYSTGRIRHLSRGALLQAGTRVPAPSSV